MEQTPDPDELFAQRLAEARENLAAARKRFDAAVESMRDAAADIEKASAALARWTGAKSAFDAVARAATKAADLSASTQHALEGERGESGEGEAPRAADVVLRVIADQPGLRGFEIVAAAEKMGTPLRERTTRTALWRLKNAKKIKSFGERWYLIDADPALADQVGGSDDAAT